MKYKDIILKLKPIEKASLFTGLTFWSTNKINEIPSIRFSDGPNGLRKEEKSDNLGLSESLKSICYPTLSAIASSWNTNLIKEMGYYLGVEAISLDVDVLLGPGVNIIKNPLAGRSFEYLSEDPYLAGILSSNYINGVYESGIDSCIKHFCCNNQETMRMTSNSVVDERTLREIYLLPFEIAIKNSKVNIIMSSYNKVNGFYLPENKHILDILYNEFNYNGIFVSDWGSINNIVDSIRNVAIIEMPVTPYAVEDILNSDISEDLLNERLDKILDFTFENKNRKRIKNFNLDKAHDLAYKCALESIVLLKNDNVLPLVDMNNITIIGDSIIDPIYQGEGSSKVNPYKLKNFKEILDEHNIKYNSYYKYKNKALKYIKNSNTILYFMSLDRLNESEGIDRVTLSFSKKQIKLYQKLRKLNKKIIVIYTAGSSVDLMPILNADGIIQTGLSGEALYEALYDILSGKVSPSGHLSSTIIKNTNEISEEKDILYKEGIFVGYRYYDLFKDNIIYPFGYGLSYTSFSYSNLKVYDKYISFNVKNIGFSKGAFLAQLYISKESNIIRPKKELKGFVKDVLDLNEEKEYRIYFDEFSFRVFDVISNKYVIEKGYYNIFIGIDANSIVLKDSIYKDGVELKKDNYNFDSYYKDFAIRSNYKYQLVPKKYRIITDLNTNVMELKYSMSIISRFFSYFMIFLYYFLLKLHFKKTANLIKMGVLYMPIRGFAKFLKMPKCKLDGIILICNGHFIKGIKTYYKK